jgi:hypothetical protein
MSTADVSLTIELDFYQQHRSEWAKSHNEQFVLIRGKAAEGFYADYESALSAGLRAFGFHEQFLIKQISSAEPVFVIY